MLNFNSKKNIFHSRITILLALGAAILVAAPPNNPKQPPNSWAAASTMATVANVKWRYRRSVADPTTLSSEALEQLTKRHFYEQQKTRYPCYKTFYVGKLKYFTIASLYFCIRHRRRLGFADFNAEAKWQMANLVFLLKGRLLTLSANIRLGWPFAILLQR